MNRRTVWLFLAFLLLGALAACARRPGPGVPRIAVVPKGTTHEFWKAVHAGARKASKEEHVEVVWKGPLREDNLKDQIDIVEMFTAQGISGLVLAPLNERALGNAARSAMNAKIPVVVFDSNLQGVAPTSFVATDNVGAGRLAGERLAALLGGRGKVILLRYQEGSASTEDRERGFLEEIRRHPGIEVISDNQHTGATTESAFAMSENLLSAQRVDGHGGHGIFCPNESTTFGMMLALQKAGLAGKVRFVGFDSSEKLIDGLRRGVLDGLVVQDPFKMGYLAVRAMARHLRGEAVEARVDTGATWVARENLGEPAFRELLAPDVTRWLEE